MKLTGLVPPSFKCDIICTGQRLTEKSWNYLPHNEKRDGIWSSGSSECIQFWKASEIREYWHNSQDIRPPINHVIFCFSKWRLGTLSWHHWPLLGAYTFHRWWLCQLCSFGKMWGWLMEGDGQNEDNNVEISTMAILFLQAPLCSSFYFTGAIF